MRSHWSRVDPSPTMTGVLIKYEIWRHKYSGRGPCSGESKDQGDALASQGMPKVTNNHQKPWDRNAMESPSQIPEETNRADTFISDFQPPELQNNTFLLSKPLGLWYFVRTALRN